MPVRYFIAMCVASLLLAGLVVFSLPSDSGPWSSDGETPSAPEPERIAPAPVASTVPDPAPQAPLTVPPPMAPEETGPVLTSDVGGTAVARVAAPELMPLPALTLPNEVVVTEKAPRELPAPVGAPEPVAKVADFRPAPVPPAPELRPAAPMEHVPPALGKVPVRTTLPGGPPKPQAP